MPTTTKLTGPGVPASGTRTIPENRLMTYEGGEQDSYDALVHHV